MNFLSKNYLLIHGTADTWVHQQHTMLLTKSLIQQGVIFRHQVKHFNIVIKNNKYQQNIYIFLKGLHG